jgi:hypothetical protein
MSRAKRQEFRYFVRSFVALDLFLSRVGIATTVDQLVKSLFTWLLLLCVLGGLTARTLAVDTSHAPRCGEPVTCCDDLHEVEVPAEHQHGGEDCPLEHHHHHGCCAHPLPLTLDSTLSSRLGILGYSLLAVSHEGEITPEEPFFGLEKPPLI